MDYLDILKLSKEEADNTPQEVIRAELSKKLEPDVRKIYNKNLYELWHGDDLCEYAGIDYDDTSDENVNKMRYVALLAAKKGVCFTYQIDEQLYELVDIAMSVEGVLGAGRTGAGLGGCISVLLEKDKTDDLIKKVSEEYYRPRNLQPAVEICFPVEGAGVIERCQRIRVAD